jgi:hypothetical protein
VPVCAAQQRLREHQPHGQPAERAQPPQPLVARRRQQPGEHQRQDHDTAGRQTVAVLDQHAALHLRHQRAVAGRPVGAGQAGSGSVNQAPDQDQQVGGDRRRDREAVDDAGVQQHRAAL